MRPEVVDHQPQHRHVEVAAGALQRGDDVGGSMVNRRRPAPSNRCRPSPHHSARPLALARSATAWRGTPASSAGQRSRTRSPPAPARSCSSSSPARAGSTPDRPDRCAGPARSTEHRARPATAHRVPGRHRDRAASSSATRRRCAPARSERSRPACRTVPAHHASLSRSRGTVHPAGEVDVSLQRHHRAHVVGGATPLRRRLSHPMHPEPHIGADAQVVQLDTRQQISRRVVEVDQSNRRPGRFHTTSARPSPHQRSEDVDGGRHDTPPTTGAPRHPHHHRPQSMSSVDAVRWIGLLPVAVRSRHRAEAPCIPSLLAWPLTGRHTPAAAPRSPTRAPAGGCRT